MDLKHQIEKDHVYGLGGSFPLDDLVAWRASMTDVEFQNQLLIWHYMGEYLRHMDAMWRHEQQCLMEQQYYARMYAQAQHIQQYPADMSACANALQAQLQQANAPAATWDPARQAWSLQS